MWTEIDDYDNVGTQILFLFAYFHAKLCFLFAIFGVIVLIMRLY